MTDTPQDGWVDLQINGYQGVDFSSPTLEEASFLRACEAIQASGTTTFLPTLITCSPAVAERNLRLMAKAIAKHDLEQLAPGFHLEGPFLANGGGLGAHNASALRPPDCHDLDQLRRWSDDSIRLLTLAAELPQAGSLIRHARRAGITVSIGHSLYDEAALEAAANAGATALTHLGNALPAQLPRHEHPLFAALLEDRLSAMLIPDGHHLPDTLLRLILKVKGLKQTIAVSDAAPIAGLPPGRYETLGNTVVLEPSGRLFNPQKGCLVGSSSSLADCMQQLARLGLSPAELQQVGRTNPARLIGLDIAGYSEQPKLQSQQNPKPEKLGQVKSRQVRAPAKEEAQPQL